MGKVEEIHTKNKRPKEQANLAEVKTNTYTYTKHFFTKKPTHEIAQVWLYRWFDVLSVMYKYTNNNSLWAELEKINEKRQTNKHTTTNSKQQKREENNRLDSTS